MRNLYSRLGISASSSQAQIEAAITACANPSLKADAEEVLLKEAHRQAYDKVHTTLAEIGYLRSGLGLNFADNWYGDEANDYTISTSKYQEISHGHHSHDGADAYQFSEAINESSADWFV